MHKACQIRSSVGTSKQELFRSTPTPLGNKRAKGKKKKKARPLTTPKQEIEPAKLNG